MKKFLFPLYWIMVITACSLPQAAVTPAPFSVTSEVPPSPIPALPTEIIQAPAQNTYTNDAFGLGFEFPADWFGPDEYISDQTLRIEVGSDNVYPYGTSPEERIYALKNSYYVVIQYSKNDQNQYWNDIHQSLLSLNDGESISDARGLLIRVGRVSLSRFEGIEFISTLSETAQTSPVYFRQVILYDGQSNLLTVMGTPNNVEVANGANWRDIYRMIDETNMNTFHEILASITIE